MWHRDLPPKLSITRADRAKGVAKHANQDSGDSEAKDVHLAVVIEVGEYAVHGVLSGLVVRGRLELD